MSFEDAVALRDRLNAAREQGLSYEDASRKAVSESQSAATVPASASGQRASAEVDDERTASAAEAPAADRCATGPTGRLIDG